MYKSNALNKMLLLSPEVYEKLKNDIDDTKSKSRFDKVMVKILQNKSLSDKEKWYNYRNELIKFSNIKRKAMQVLDKKSTNYLPLEKTPVEPLENTLEKPSKKLPKQKKSFRDNTTQTRFIFKDEIPTQTSPIKEKTPERMPEDIFEIGKITPPRRSLSPTTKRRLSASNIAKSLNPRSKIQRTISEVSTNGKDYRVITADDGITQYTVPVDMSVDEAAGLIEELEEEENNVGAKQKTRVKQPILRPSQLDPSQYMLSFPVKKAIRQSERLRSKTRSTSVPDITWERI